MRPFRLTRHCGQLLHLTNDEYLLPIGKTDVAQYAPGLTLADFGPVEMGIHYAAGTAGGIAIGGVQSEQIVPEPTSLIAWLLLGITCISAGYWKHTGKAVA